MYTDDQNKYGTSIDDIDIIVAAQLHAIIHLMQVAPCHFDPAPLMEYCDAVSDFLQNN